MTRLGRRRLERLPPTVLPGTLAIDSQSPFPEIRVMAYGPDDLIEEQVGDVSELDRFVGRWPVAWINVDGLGDEAWLAALGKRFRLHRLVLEDIVNLGQRPKVEAYEDMLFVVANQAHEADDAEQISFVLGRDFLLTFQERRGDVLEGVRQRIREGRPTIRAAGPDYLLYALLDAIIDAYFPIVERLREDLDDLEDEVLGDPDQDVVGRIHDTRRRLRSLRRTVGPHREAINAMLRDTDVFLGAETRIHLRDCYDHLLRLFEVLEVYREQCADLMGAHLSAVSNRMNEVMKVLTIIATIFIPLGFIAGVYGMNFDSRVSPWNMPELGWAWGYPAVLALMTVVAGGLLWYFARRGWLR